MLAATAPARKRPLKAGQFYAISRESEVIAGNYVPGRDLAGTGPEPRHGRAARGCRNVENRYSPAPTLALSE